MGSLTYSVGLQLRWIHTDQIVRSGPKFIITLFGLMTVIIGGSVIFITIIQIRGVDAYACKHSINQGNLPDLIVFNLSPARNHHRFKQDRPDSPEMVDVYNHALRSNDCYNRGLCNLYNDYSDKGRRCLRLQTFHKSREPSSPDGFQSVTSAEPSSV